MYFFYCDQQLVARLPKFTVLEFKLQIKNAICESHPEPVGQPTADGRGQKNPPYYHVRIILSSSEIINPILISNGPKALKGINPKSNRYIIKKVKTSA